MTQSFNDTNFLTVSANRIKKGQAADPFANQMIKAITILWEEGNSVDEISKNLNISTDACIETLAIMG